MKPLFTLLPVVLVAQSIIAQVEQGGKPYHWDQYQDVNFQVYDLPKANIAALIADDLDRDIRKNELFRFGANISVDLDINNSGTWLHLPNGDRIWRLGINSSGAKSLNFVFDHYQPCSGSQVFVYSLDKSELKGSFTSDNISPIGSLGVGLISSSAIVIEYHVPASASQPGYLHIDNVTHGYRAAIRSAEEDLGKVGPFGDSGDCNVNVNCPEGILYEIQKRSVALIVVNGNALASGAVLNNTAQDNKPYFLTADHAIPEDLSEIQNWVFYFNHEAENCIGNDGPTNQSVSGATFRAQNAVSDFGLVEFNSAIPSSYNVCYSGWDASDSEAAVTSAYGIHHPAGDVKKISIEDDAPYHVSQEGFAQKTWWIDQWEAGVTEGGSSGSPLFNQAGLVIGQLAGGTAACNGSVNNGGLDFYGRFGVSWNEGATQASRLKDWLDPINTGELTLASSCNVTLQENNVSLGNFSTTEVIYCPLTPYNPSISVYNTGSNDVTSLSGTISVNGVSEPFDWNGIIPAGTDGVVDLGEVSILSGENTISVDLPFVNGQEDPSLALNTISQNINFLDDPELLTVNISLDNYPGETTWEIKSEQGATVYSGGSYTESDSIFTETFCMPTGCYSFEIFDSVNDGICCLFGMGSYTITDGQENELASGGEFQDSEITDFCLGLTNDNDDNNLKSLWLIYPNPAQTNVTVDFGSLTVSSLHVFDITGRVVDSYSNTQVNNKKNAMLDPSGWNKGIYFIEITTNLGFSSCKQLIVQ